MTVGMTCNSTEADSSILAALMMHGTNWDKIVRTKLDNDVTYSKNAEDENDPNFAALVDFRPLFGYRKNIVHEVLKLGHKKAQVMGRKASDCSSVMNERFRWF